MKAIKSLFKNKTKQNTYLAKWDRNLGRRANQIETKETNFSNGSLLVKTPSSHLPTPLLCVVMMLDIYLPRMGDVIDGTLTES